MTTDQTMPAGKWTFDDSVTDAFDDMLERSIPAYNTMRDLTTRLAVAFLQPGSDVVDIGCSRGTGLAMIRDAVRLESRGEPDRYVGVDVSEPMLAAARQRFAGDQSVRIDYVDLRLAYPDVAASVTLAVLTLQFVPVEHRWRVLQDAFDSTIPGGAILVVEKVLGGSSALHRVMDDEYLRFKGRSGYSDEAVARKKASLEGVLVSQTASLNEHMLRGVGYRDVECYYRWLNFAGWIGVRPR